MLPDKLSKECGNATEIRDGCGNLAATCAVAGAAAEARRLARAWNLTQNMCWPPLMAMLAPVTNAASSDVR